MVWPSRYSFGALVFGLKSVQDSLRALALGPSAWLTRFSRWFSPDMRVLEIACGMGRNTWYLSHLGTHVTCCDIKPMPEVPPGALFELRDLEAQAWSYPPESFDAVVGINYLYRPHFVDLLACVRPGGFVLYETFSVLQGEFCEKPRNPDHLLGPGELLRLLPCAQWHVAAYEDGKTDFGQYVERIAAVRRSNEVICAPSLCASR